MKPLFKQGDVVVLKKFTPKDELAHVVYMNSQMIKAGGIKCKVKTVHPNRHINLPGLLRCDGSGYFLSPLSSRHEKEYRISEWIWVSSMFESPFPYLF